MASYLDYTVNTEFLSKRPLPDLENLRACIRLYADYYNLMREEKWNATQQKLVRESAIDGEQLATDFIAFSQQKNRGEKNPALVATLNAAIKPTADYFRRAFLDVEIEKLKQISLRDPLSLAEQARRLDTHGTYSRQELFSTGFFATATRPQAAPTLPVNITGKTKPFTF